MFTPTNEMRFKTVALLYITQSVKNVMMQSQHFNLLVIHLLEIRVLE